MDRISDEHDERSPLIQPQPAMSSLSDSTSSTEVLTEFRTEIHHSKREKPAGIGRWFYVEITIILFFLSDFPLNIIMQKYTLEWTKEQIMIKDNITLEPNETISPCSVNVSEELRRFNEQVQSTSSMISAVQSVVRGVPAVFSTLILGAASDRFGRRYAVLPACCGVFVYSVAVLIVTLFRLPVYYAFIGDFLYGCTGLMQGLVMGCCAHIGDNTPSNRLAVRLGFMAASAFGPILISSMSVGPLVARLGYWGTVLIASIFLIANVVYVTIFMRGFNQKQSEIKLVDSSSSMGRVMLNQVKSALSILCKQNENDEKYTSVRLILLILSGFFLTMTTADANVSNYFIMNSPLCWSLTLVGWFNGVSMASSAIGTVLVLPLQKRCMSENVIAIMSTTAGTLVCLYKFTVVTTWMMFIAPVFSLFIMQAYTCVRAMISKLAGPDRQGAVFGMLSSVEVMCTMVGTTIFNAVYSETLHISSGFVFIVVALVYLIATIILTIHYFIERRVKCSTNNVHIQKENFDNQSPGSI